MKRIGPVVLLRGVGRVSGRILDQSGLPLEGLRLMALREGEKWNFSQTARTDGEGEFVLEHLPAEILKIRVMASEGRLGRLAVFPEARTVDLGKGKTVHMRDWSVLRNNPYHLQVDLIVAGKSVRGSKLRLRREWILCYAIVGTWSLREIEEALASPGGLSGRFGSKLRRVKIPKAKPMVLVTRSSREPLTLFFQVPPRFAEYARSAVRHVEPRDGGRDRITIRF